MPITYEIVEPQRLVLARGAGIVTGSDVIAHLDTLSADPRYVPPMKKIVDYRTIENIKISLNDAESIAEKKKTLADRFGGEKCAFVSPGDLSYGTSRVHQALVENAGIDTRVFRRFEDALAWLDVVLEADQE